MRNFAIDSHTRWFLQIRRQIVLLICSYQHTDEIPNTIDGQTRRGANFLNTYYVPFSPIGVGKYGWIHAFINSETNDDGIELRVIVNGFYLVSQNDEGQ